MARCGTGHHGDYSFFAFNFETMQPDYGGTLLPHLAGPVAWLEYTAYQRYGDASYLAAADDAMGFLHSLNFNPNHDLLLPYAGIAAARMNAEIGRNYNVGKFINWHFDNNGDVNESTPPAGMGRQRRGDRQESLPPRSRRYTRQTLTLGRVLAPVV